MTEIKNRWPKTIKSSLVVKCWSLKKLTVMRWEKSAFALREGAASM